jgi:hypothetical protein
MRTEVVAGLGDARLPPARMLGYGSGLRTSASQPGRDPLRPQHLVTAEMRRRLACGRVKTQPCCLRQKTERQPAGQVTSNGAMGPHGGD